VPILREETSLYPDTLLDEAPAITPTSQDGQASVSCEATEPCPASTAMPPRRWFVLYTKARQEKALARELLTYQIPFYLPLIKKTTLSRGRRRTSFAPLLGGYVFLYATEEERVRSLTTNRISRILPVDDGAQLVHDLRQIRRLISANVPLTVESRMGPGQKVRVRQGAFAGVEGIVLKRRGETRLLVSINFLQQGASVEIEDFRLDPID
jgi:transcriptional antiterminator RfaH